MSSQLKYDVFVTDAIPQNVEQPVPNGERRMFSPLSVTLISGAYDAVLVDPPMTSEQTEQVGDWVAASGKNLTHIFVTHGHGDHWFGAAELAARFDAIVVATPGTIEQMKLNVAIRPVFWDALFPGQIPETDVTAVPAVDNVIELEGHKLFVIGVGYNGVHQFLREAAGDGIKRWHEAIDIVAALEPQHIVTGHKNKHLDDNADRVIADTRSYLNAAAELLGQEQNALGFFNAMLQRFPERLNAGALWGSATALYPEPA
jgi:hypothetical protein